MARREPGGRRVGTEGASMAGGVPGAVGAGVVGGTDGTVDVVGWKVNKVIDPLSPPPPPLCVLAATTVLWPNRPKVEKDVVVQETVRAVMFVVQELKTSHAPLW